MVPADTGQSVVVCCECRRRHTHVVEGDVAELDRDDTNDAPSLIHIVPGIGGYLLLWVDHRSVYSVLLRI